MNTESNPIWMGRIAQTPLGSVWLAGSRNGLVAVNLWPERSSFVSAVERLTGHTPRTDQDKVSLAAIQIEEYLRGKRLVFELPIDWSVLTPFQEKVLRRVSQVPFGRVTTYKEIAKEIDRPKAVRAVGRANATNPMPLVIPCHRVLGTDGKLHGYGAPGGLETKAWLLRLEGSWLI